ncbi:bifunctional MFS transporter superfamily/Major facilitator superfamily [Babesia duncani]|uniref:Bifunctional MFS transporter superfamily/Major facilitator superfamily n=1 Tax=Babesia duncani TaxID=323732 RepID=A0AAD9UPS3_9APIC|nr:bifunctional MFS transporter superfamily/Major facilitator superfamily [Babesia duncani]
MTELSISIAADSSRSVAPSEIDPEKATSAMKNEEKLPKTTDEIDWKRLAMSFFVCCLSSIMLDILRIPLSISKVDIQRDLGVSTLELSHVDTGFLLAHALGHAVSPIVSPKSQKVLFCSIFQCVMGLIYPILFFCNDIRSFIFIFSIIGFMLSPFWVVMYSFLGSWLPKQYEFVLFTVYLTSDNVGHIIGNIMCTYVHTLIYWRAVFIMAGCLNIIGATILFTCFNEKYMINDHFPPGHSIARENIKVLSRLYHKIRTPEPNKNKFINNSPLDDVIDPRRQFITSGLDVATCEQTTPNTFFLIFGYCKKTITKCLKGIIRLTTSYISVIKKIEYLLYHVVAYALLKMAKQGFAFWVIYYLSTRMSFSLPNATWVAAMFSTGCAIGNLTVGYIVSKYMEHAPIRACAIWTAAASACLAVFGMLSQPTVSMASFVAVLYGIFSIGSETLILTRGIQTLCDATGITAKESIMILGFTLSSASFCMIFQGVLITFVVKWLVYDFCKYSPVSVGAQSMQSLPPF